MRSVARELDGLPVSLLGVNLGRVGFLAALTVEELWPCLERCLEKGLPVSELMVLSFAIVRGDEVKSRGRAVNDLVVHRGAGARLVSINISVWDEVICTIRADGLIVSTSTGSTAYNVSAGGPLVHPGISAINLTAICPFLSGFSPMVLPQAASVTVSLGDRASQIYVAQDGQVSHPFTPGDELRIKRAETGLYLAVPDKSSYFARLKQKGFLRSAG